MIRALSAAACAALLLPLGASAAGPADGLAYLDHTLRRLHSEEVVNLRQRYGGKPLLIVNTASHCGYTGQFKALEALHRQYKERGLKVVGFASNDFRQEAANEAEAAQVCFVNYGVSFDMFAPIGVSGDGAHAVFRELARQSGAPRWNFHKYVVDRNGKVIASFPSRVEPDSREVREAIERAL
ncbi:Hydroperoxy fatty acid reductase gpx1 [Azoarcus sp. Aa7]|nr:Hydroperoxy fatty acid reductase gpx1 [Azoarcus sp. Aa7]